MVIDDLHYLPTTAVTTLPASSTGLRDYFDWRVRVPREAAGLMARTLDRAWILRHSIPADPAVQRLWLFTIAANVICDDRARRRRTAVPAPRRAEAPDLRNTTRRLEDAHRELVLLIHWDGRTVLEAAELLGRQPSLAPGRYAAARRTLRDALAETACR
jgi:RNA polymerase sigma-70 factor (ECF subfamily)